MTSIELVAMEVQHIRSLVETANSFTKAIESEELKSRHDKLAQMLRDEGYHCRTYNEEK